MKNTSIQRAVLLVLILSVSLKASAAYMSFAFTNSLGAPITNDFRLVKVGDTLANGSVIPQGLPIKVTPASDGRATNRLQTGNWYATNSYLSQVIRFRVPQDDGPTVYFFTDPGIWVSGGSYFVTQVIGGSNSAPTYNQVTNALGYLPLTQSKLDDTNSALIARIIATNGLNMAATVTNIGGAATNLTVKASGGASSKAISAKDVLGAEQMFVDDEGLWLPQMVSSQGLQLVGVNDSGLLSKFDGTLTNSTTGSSSLATNSINATNIYGAGLVAMTNAATQVSTGATNGLNSALVTRITLATNALAAVVTFNLNSASNVLRQATINATNDLNTTLATRIQNSTNDLNTALIAADTVVSNGLSARIVATNAALATRMDDATNSLNTALSTKITNATNSLNSALVTRIQNATNDLNTALVAANTVISNGLSSRLIATNAALISADTVVSNGLSARLIATNTSLQGQILNATNGLNSALVTKITDATNSLNSALVTAGTTISNGLSSRLIATNAALLANDTTVSNGLSARIIATNSLLTTRITDATNSLNTALLSKISATTNDYKVRVIAAGTNITVLTNASAGIYTVSGSFDSNSVYTIGLQAAYTVGGATGGVTVATANTLAQTNIAWRVPNMLMSGTNLFPGSAVTGTLTNNTTGSAGSVLSIVDPLNGKTNSAFLTSLIASNSTYGSWQINQSGSAQGVNTYNGGTYFLPGPDGAFSFQPISGTAFYDVWGAANNAMVRIGDSNFRGVMFNKFGFASPYNNLQEGGVAVTSVGIYGGSGAALYDLPIRPEQNAEALPYPPTVVTSWNLVDETLHQTNLWAQLQDCTTNGLLYAFTNQGMPLWYHMDSNVRWLTNYRVSGELAINTAAFPAGTNILRQFQTSGWKFSLTHYAVKMPTNSAVYVSQTGNEVVAGTAGSVPAMTPNSAAADVKKFYEWGIDMFRASDVINDTGYQRYWPRVIANLILNPKGANYRYFWKDQYNHNGSIFRPMAFQWMTPRLGEKDGEAYSQANVVNHDARNNGYGAWLGDISAGTEVEIGSLNLTRTVQTNEVPHLKPGHWTTGQSIFTDASTTMRARWLLTPSSLQCALLNVTMGTNGGLFSFMPNVASQMTNAGWVAIRKDFAAGQLPFFAQDNGATNTSVLVRKLSNGDYAVGFFNEAASQQTVNLRWSELRVPEFQYYFATDVWNGTNMTAYNRSMSVTLAAKEMRLLRLSPCVVEHIRFTQLADSFLRLSPSAQSPAAAYMRDGLYHNGSATRSARFSVPGWVTNATFSAYVQCSAAATWTNLIEPNFSAADGLLVYSGTGINASNNVLTIATANAVSNYTFTVTWPATNVNSKGFEFKFLQATNTAASYYFGPDLKAIYR